MKLVFMGTPDFAATSLTALLSSSHLVDLVITQPDRPRGRGMKASESPVKVVAGRSSIRVAQPPSIADQGLVDSLRALDPDAIVVVAYGQKIPESILDMPRFGCINVHASLLPLYRGAAPINRAIMDGQSRTGVTTMFMDKGWDTGDMILQKPVDIGEHMNAGDLHDLLAEEGADLLVETLDLLEAGRAPRIPQDHARATMAPKLRPEESRIDFTADAETVRNQVRGLTPYPGCYTMLDGARLKVLQVRLCDDSAEDGEPGTVRTLPDSDSHGIAVYTGRGSIIIDTLQPEGSRPMSAGDFVNGYRIEVGQRLG